MGNWILHIVGETLDKDLSGPISAFVQEIEKLDHVVHQVRLTTDAGEKTISVDHGEQETPAEDDTETTEEEAPVESATPEVDPTAEVTSPGSSPIPSATS